MGQGESYSPPFLPPSSASRTVVELLNLPLLVHPRVPPAHLCLGVLSTGDLWALFGAGRGPRACRLQVEKA